MITDFITIYENALTDEYCAQWVEYINYLRGEGLITQEIDKLHKRDHETINFSNDDGYDLTSADKLVRTYLPNIKPCVDKGTNLLSIIKTRNALYLNNQN